MHFSTLEKRLTSRFTSDNLAQQMQAETLEELEEIWRQNRAAGRQREVHDAESIQRLRVKNLADRILSKERIQDATIDGEEIIESVLLADNPGLCTPGRSRRGSLTDESLFASPSRLPPRSPAAYHLPSRGASPVRSRRGSLTDESLFASPSRLPPRSPAAPRLPSRGASPVRSLRLFDRPPAETGKGNLALEYSDHGTGDFRTPSFSITTSNASSISPLRFRNYRIIAGKPPLPDFLPGIRCTASDASTLIVTMSDVYAGIEVNLYYTCLHNYNAILR